MSTITGIIKVRHKGIVIATIIPQEQTFYASGSWANIYYRKGKCFSIPIKTWENRRSLCGVEILFWEWANLDTGQHYRISTKDAETFGQEFSSALGIRWEFPLDHTEGPLEHLSSLRGSLT